MSCDRDPCISPRCKSADWVASSKTQSDFAAFMDEVHAYMREHDRHDFGRCVKIVFDRAQAGECVFG